MRNIYAAAVAVACVCACVCACMDAVSLSFHNGTFFMDSDMQAELVSPSYYDGDIAIDCARVGDTLLVAIMADSSQVLYLADGKKTYIPSKTSRWVFGEIAMGALGTAKIYVYPGGMVYREPKLVIVLSGTVQYPEFDSVEEAKKALRYKSNQM